MARTRRRVSRGTSSARRVKADWVYRPSSRQISPQPAGSDLVGTYEQGVRTLNSGLGNAQGLVLYDSSNYLQVQGRSPAGQSSITGAARAEGAKPTILAVEGTLFFEPTTWALGNVIALGVRLGVLEQDSALPVPVVDTDYSMWVNGATTEPARFANNGRSNMREWRMWRGFSDNGAVFQAHFRWRGRRKLEGTEALFLWMELQTTSVNLRYQTWFRSLVSATG